MIKQLAIASLLLLAGCGGPSVEKKAADFMTFAYVKYVVTGPRAELGPVDCRHKRIQEKELILCEYGQYSNQPWAHHRGLWEVQPTGDTFKVLAVNGKARSALGLMPKDPSVGELPMPVNIDIEAAIAEFP